ncbi:hypothetical protein HDE_03469 [Halotydeus destructor]|nr:hypothetical protein HDE_03469 [Halotydeus destructor]
MKRAILYVSCLIAICSAVDEDVVRRLLKHNDKEYLYLQGNSKLHQARSRCSDMNGKLLEPRTDDDVTFILYYFGKFFWADAYYDVVNGGWQWLSDGSPVVNLNWGDKGGPACQFDCERYGLTIDGSAVWWAVDTVNSLQGVICERSLDGDFIDF